MNSFVSVLVLLSAIEFAQSKMDKEKLCECKGLTKVRPIETYRMPDGRVVHGEPVLDVEMQFVASVHERILEALKKYHDLWIPDLKNQVVHPFCTGSVLNPSWVLTAAHCLHYIRDKGEGSYAKFFVAAGLDHNLRSIIPSTANNRGIYEIYPHPNFTKIRGVSYHDVGLIQLNYAFDLNAKTNIFPVCLINEDEKRFGNLYGAGYGMTSILMLDEPVPDVLIGKESADLTLETKGRFSYALLMSPLNQTFDGRCPHCLVTTNNNRSLCFGDSGGPLLTLYRNRFYLVGVTSFAAGYSIANKQFHCVPGSIDFGTWVYPYLPWIKGYISKDELCVQKRW